MQNSITFGELAWESLGYNLNTTLLQNWNHDHHNNTTKMLLQNLVNFLETGCLFYSSSWTQTCCDPSASGSWVLGFRTQLNKLPKATVLIYKERSTKFHTKTFKCLKCPYVSLISIFIRDIYSLTSLLKLYTEQLIFPVKDKAHPQTFVFNSAKTIFLESQINH